jgi:hypothetical protein
MVRYVKKNRCKKIRAWIEPYFDDELSLSKHAKVEAHLKECRSCRKEFERLQGIQKLIRHGFSASMAGGHPNLEGLSSRVRDQIRSSDQADRGRSIVRRSLWFGSWGTRILVPSAAVAALIAVFVFTIYKPHVPVIRIDGKNECIVESLEGGSRTVMLFKTHGSNMTVIWLSGGSESNREAVKLWRKYSV